jgi:hypothetical protein
VRGGELLAGTEARVEAPPRAHLAFLPRITLKTFNEKLSEIAATSYPKQLSCLDYGSSSRLSSRSFELTVARIW